MNKPLWTDSEWTFERIHRSYDEIEKIGIGELGLNVYKNQIEIISSEQMLDAYTSIGMPIYYNHWSFGKSFAREWDNYKSGKSGLAYELVINSNPCINYLMEENTMMTQALVMAHAACVSGDTEYLSPTGWRKIADYDGGLVAQFEEGGTARFVQPLRYVKKVAESDLIHVQSSSIDQLITDDHTVVFWNGNGNLVKITGKELETRQASKTRGFNGRFITGFNMVGVNGLSLSDDEIRLHIAIKADGSYLQKGDNPDHFNYVPHHRVRFHLKKERKIERLEALLGRLNIAFVKAPTYGGRFNITFDIPTKIPKQYDVEWYSASADQLKLIAEEVLLWDGSVSSKKFSSSLLCDIDFIQYAFAASGKHTHVYEGTRCWNVQFSTNASRSLSRHGRDGRQEAQPFSRQPSADGLVYCFTVPSGMFISRRNRRISVTGNCGHNHFFKNNYLFKQWTDADAIVDYLVFARDYVMKTEAVEGRKAVEQFLDSCHALMDYGVNRYKRPAKLSLKKEKERQREREAYLQTQVDEFYRLLPTQQRDEDEDEEQFPKQPEENILYFCEKHSPSLKPWQRELIRIVRKMAQYFYPQGQTKVANEGFASWTHYTIMNRLHEKGLTTDGAHMEFLALHSAVLFQPNFDSPYFSGHLNPYKLGFEILRDIERICKTPTDEDRRWFPDLVGQDSLEVIKNAVADYRDESFIRQFLSPKVIRDFRLFQIKDDREEDHYVVTAIQNERGYEEVRTSLADQHERDAYVPHIEVSNVDPESRALTLIYRDHRGRELKDPKFMMHHIYRLWGFEVRLEDEHGYQIASI